MTKKAHSVTFALKEYQKGEEEALDKLMPLVHGELKRIAQYHLGPKAAEQTLSPPALVNELFLRLKKSEPLAVEDRAAFYRAAATCMRQILIDHIRAKRTSKRGGQAFRVTLEEGRIDSGRELAPGIEELGDALEALRKFDPRLGRIVELRYLVGLNIEEVAQVLAISPTTIKRDWAVAKAWLLREMSRQ